MVLEVLLSRFSGSCCWCCCGKFTMLRLLLLVSTGTFVAGFLELTFATRWVSRCCSCPVFVIRRLVNVVVFNGEVFVDSTSLEYLDINTSIDARVTFSLFFHNEAFDFRTEDFTATMSLSSAVDPLAEFKLLAIACPPMSASNPVSSVGCGEIKVLPSTAMADNNKTLNHK